MGYSSSGRRGYPVFWGEMVIAANALEEAYDVPTSLRFPNDRLSGSVRLHKRPAVGIGFVTLDGGLKRTAFIASGSLADSTLANAEFEGIACALKEVDSTEEGVEWIRENCSLGNAPSVPTP